MDQGCNTHPVRKPDVKPKGEIPSVPIDNQLSFGKQKIIVNYSTAFWDLQLIGDTPAFLFRVGVQKGLRYWNNTPTSKQNLLLSGLWPLKLYALVF
ncbi:hypothetical protein AVEN_176574-1 [Araneus ventricosus]|uniref:Uncharacterized protein n=1 Tax=Araneus ventricosus TaxID=182803 RepID=A0A4Y2VNA7_ARAVE|nr:hypothetical protein AVEN_176574-1 [Araneus ventricosus]